MSIQEFGVFLAGATRRSFASSATVPALFYCCVITCVHDTNRIVHHCIIATCRMIANKSRWPHQLTFTHTIYASVYWYSISCIFIHSLITTDIKSTIYGVQLHVNVKHCQKKKNDADFGLREPLAYNGPMQMFGLGPYGPNLPKKSWCIK
jgi:hypothetical protein